MQRLVKFPKDMFIARFLEKNLNFLVKVKRYFVDYAKNFTLKTLQ